MNKLRVIGIIVAAIIFILMMVFLFIEINAGQNCQEYKTICYRSELNWMGFNSIETQCKNQWDFQEINCVDKGFFWEDLK